MHSVCLKQTKELSDIFRPTCNHNTIDDRSRLYYFCGLFSSVLFAYCFALLCSRHCDHVVHFFCESNTYTCMRHRNTHTLIRHTIHHTKHTIHSHPLPRLLSHRNTLNRIENKVCTNTLMPQNIVIYLE